MVNRISIAALMAAAFLTTNAQLNDIDVIKTTDSQPVLVKEVITIPDVNGLKALKCDFHVHTVFSDGSVLPKDRVSEALSRGLDAMAITDHIEYRPHKEYVIGDFNTSFDQAKKAVEGKDLILVKGAEITRAKPIGHLNALFIQDANPLDVKDPLEAIDIAKKQGAFLMWNHPGWPNDSATIYPVHKELIKAGKINGVEVVNSTEYYPKSFNYCKEYNLAYMGCTDIHGVYTHSYRTDRQSAPLTIVFARERSAESIKEALFAQRSIVKFGDLLIGSAENLKSLAFACLPYDVLEHDHAMAKVRVSNKSSLLFALKIGTKIVDIDGGKTITIKVPLDATIKFMNTHITDNTQLEIAVSSL